MDPQKITELANLLRNNGDKILNSEFNFTLSGSLLRALNDSFTLIADSTEIGPSPQSFQVVKPINSKSSVFRDLQLVHDFVQKTAFLCIIHYPSDDYFEGTIDITKFRSLKRLEVQKTNVKQIVGIQPLRSQIQQLICVKSLHNVDDIITNCGGDNSNGFVWNELKIADFSYNNLNSVDSSLEFAQYLQHLNLRHNNLVSVEAIKWLPNLKTLDLSFNRLTCIPQFHMEACKRLQVLNMSNNFVEDLLGIAKMDALTDLDLSDNCLMDHTYLLPLSAILTLKYLNLYGNPLHCHPKHRLATAQFLHKNTATVKFILDFETLSKSEKAITGSQQMRHAGTSFNRYSSSKSSISINSMRSSAQQTPSSSVGSLRSFKFSDSSSVDASVMRQGSLAESTSSTKKRPTKVRTVEITDGEEEIVDQKDNKSENVELVRSESLNKQQKDFLTKSLITDENSEHLKAKKHIETMREKYGAEWLQSENAEMIHSVLGIESTKTSQNTVPADEQRNISRQLFEDFLGEFSATAQQAIAPAPTTNDDTLSNTLRTSTPTDNSYLQNPSNIEQLASPIKPIGNASGTTESTVYMSINNSSNTAESTAEETLYKSANNSGLNPFEDNQDNEAAADEQEEYDHLKNVYSSTVDEESEVSEAEDDEETYIVYTAKRNEAMFLTISSNFLREKDTLKQRTKTKWSLKILESCDRIKSNTLRINFDTVKADKKERVYTIEDGLCQELEKKLRDILSKRDLFEMNQIIYRCVNCTCQFSREKKYKHFTQEIRCPECRSSFVAEIHDIPKSLEKASISAIKLSPAAAALPFEENPKKAIIGIDGGDLVNNAGADETNSIGSANSLNESSSCSKISNLQSSFDSNQSVVGSSTTDRDADFKANYESDVDILSNPSQSSIEVLDQMHTSSRKTSEERRVLQIPNLETIDDNSFQQHFVPSGITTSATQEDLVAKHMQESKQKSGALAHFNLTESSSSGSVTDSVCTAYEQQGDKTLVPDDNQQKIILENLLNVEGRNGNLRQSNGVSKKDDSGISSMFGALFQSTNILMSSSKKLIDVEATANIQPGISTRSMRACAPYKFNYTDFNDVDHRLKLYFYQNKFEEAGEHFKWLARGRIYNKNTHTLCPGIVVMSTCKCYIMEAFAPEHDDVTKWLRQLMSVTANRLESVHLLPWKIGLSFSVRDWGCFLLLLQDILRTDGLLLHFANNSLPSQCALNYQVSEQIVKRLNNAVVDEKLKMLSLLNGCEIKCENAKRCFGLCGLITTDSRLYLTSGNLSWLCDDIADVNIETDIELCVTQFMSNLVEVERPAENVFTINFLDETQDKYELWKCVFETKENAESCFNAIGQSWEKLFGVPLFTTAGS